MRHKNIITDADKEKEKIYDQINNLFLQGKAVTVKEHKSGFPTVTVDCDNTHIRTDCLSLEAWWAKRRPSSLEVDPARR